ncbi:MAG: hypothetical protein U0V74_08970 [Chitinophagales bacterium]
MPTAILHIGYPKAGSTWLQAYFSANTALFYKGELTDSYKQTGKVPENIAAKADSEKVLVLSEEQLSVWQGNIDIVGVKFQPFDIKQQQREVCLSLHKQFPEAKVLIVTRGFQSALKSMYSQYITIGGIYTFSEFLRQYAPIMGQFYDYTYLINLYRQTFGSANVVVLPFELLKDNQPQFLQLMEKDLGIPPFPFTGEKANVSLKEEELESYRSLSKLVYAMVQWLPAKAARAVYGSYVYVLYQRKFHSALKLFRSSVEQLAIPSATLSLFSGHAEVLKQEKIFEPYLKEYLI